MEDRHTVWVTLRNDKLDEVFETKEATENHAKNMIKRWNIMQDC